jgi:hypothetical protein
MRNASRRLSRLSAAWRKRRATWVDRPGPESCALETNPCKRAVACHDMLHRGIPVSSSDMITRVIGASAVPLPAGAGNGGFASSVFARRACPIAWSAYRPLREISIVEGVFTPSAATVRRQAQQPAGPSSGNTDRTRLCPPHRHMPRIRAPTSRRTCLGSGRSDTAAVTIGQVVHSNNGSRAAGMKRVREA